MYKVYCLKDIIGKIVYVGYTGKSLRTRLTGHRSNHKDRSDLSIELLQNAKDKTEAKSLEIQYQLKHNTLYPNGLNRCLGHKNNDGQKLLIAGINTRFGKRPKTDIEEQKRKEAARLSQMRLRKPVRCIETGIVYESVSMCAKTLGLSVGNLSMVLNKKRPKTQELHFEFVKVPN